VFFTISRASARLEPFDYLKPPLPGLKWAMVSPYFPQWTLELPDLPALRSLVEAEGPIIVSTPYLNRPEGPQHPHLTIFDHILE
jgi:hypothetical protein